MTPDDWDKVKYRQRKNIDRVHSFLLDSNEWETVNTISDACLLTNEQVRTALCGLKRGGSVIDKYDLNLGDRTPQEWKVT